MHLIACEPCLKFLVSSQGRATDRVNQVDGWLAIEHGRCSSASCSQRVITGGRTCYESAVISPVKAHPRPRLPWLVLKVRGLVELFVMVDTENAGRRRNNGQTRNLGQEEARSNAGHGHKRGKAVVIRNAHAGRKSWDFRVMPLDGESDGCGSHDTEVITVVGVLPDVLAIENQVASQGLLQPGVEFIAIAGSNRPRVTGHTEGRHQGSEKRDAAPSAGNYKILVEG